MKQSSSSTKNRKNTDPYQIKVIKLIKSFKGQRVINELSLNIERGKINIIIGGSGQGKSVTMKLLMGLIKPDSGHIYVDGTDIVPMSEVKLNKMRRKFGMVFQYAALFDSMTVFDNIAFPLREHTRISKGEIKDKVTHLLESVSLPGIEKKFPSELSGGMQKRVGLARALIIEPEILFYDEPTTGLDPIATRNVDELIAQTNEKYGVTSIVISHDMASTFRIAHRISMIFGGKIVEDGSPEVFMKTENEIAKQFLEYSGVV